MDDKELIELLEETSGMHTTALCKAAAARLRELAEDHRLKLRYTSGVLGEDTPRFACNDPEIAKSLTTELSLAAGDTVWLKTHDAAKGTTP